MLSDFASFKPTYLPEDNPADYTYFFDTSRRRTCYIAPERLELDEMDECENNLKIFVCRFVKSFSAETNAQKNLIGDNSLMSESIVDQSVRDGPCYTGNLLPEMDIFSAG